MSDAETKPVPAEAPKPVASSTKGAKLTLPDDLKTHPVLAGLAQDKEVVFTPERWNWLYEGKHGPEPKDDRDDSPDAPRLLGRVYVDEKGRAVAWEPAG